MVEPAFCFCVVVCFCVLLVLLVLFVSGFSFRLFYLFVCFSLCLTAHLRILSARVDVALFVCIFHCFFACCIWLSFLFVDVSFRFVFLLFFFIFDWAFKNSAGKGWIHIFACCFCCLCFSGVGASVILCFLTFLFFAWFWWHFSVCLTAHLRIQPARFELSSFCLCWIVFSI